MKKSYAFGVFPAMAALIAGALFLLGAKTKSDDTDARGQLPVAKVNEKAITLGYVESLASKQNRALRQELEKEENQLDFLNKIIEIEVLTLEAERRGYRTHAEVDSVVKNQLATLMHTRIADGIQEEEPSLEALKKRYEESHDLYHKPEMTRARHIQLSDRKKAEGVLKEMIRGKINQNDFRKKAQQISEDENTKARGGDLTFFTRVGEERVKDPKVDPMLVKAAFKIPKNGGLFPRVLKTDKGYHILMRTGHRDKTDLSFEDAKKRMTVLLKREARKNKIEEQIKTIGEKFNVQVFEENLKHVVIDLSTPTSKPDAKTGKMRKPQPGNPKRPGFVRPKAD